MPESSVGVGELGLVVSAGRLLAVLGRGQQATLETGHGRRGHAVTVPPGWASRVRRPRKQRLESGRHVYGITNGSVDRRQPGMFQRWAMGFNCSVVGPKPPKENCRWGLTPSSLAFRTISSPALTQPPRAPQPWRSTSRRQARALAYIHAARTQPLSTLSLHRHLHRHHLIIIKKLGS